MIVNSVLIFIFALIITSDARFRLGGSRSSGSSRFGSGSRGSHSSSSSYGHSSSNRGNTGSSIFGSNNHHTTSLSYPRQHESSIIKTNKNTPLFGGGRSSFGNHNTRHHTTNTHTNSFTPSAPSAPTQHIGWKPPPSFHSTLTQTHTNPYQTQSQPKPKPFHTQTQTHSTQSPFNSHSGYGHPLPNSGSTVQNIGWNKNVANPSYPTHPHGQITNANSWQTNAHVPSNTHSGSKPPYPTQIHNQNNLHSPHVPSAPPAPSIGWKVTPTHVGSGTGVSTANHGMQVSVKKITIFDSKFLVYLNDFCH